MMIFKVNNRRGMTPEQRGNRIVTAFATFMILSFILTLCNIVNAFTVTTTTTKLSHIPSSMIIKQQHQQRNVVTSLQLSSANTDEGTTEQEGASAPTDIPSDVVVEDSEGSGEMNTDTGVTEITATDDQEQQLLNSIKEEISKLESDIKITRQQLSDINDNADEYTKTGYARKVAEMENMRRARTMLQSSNKYSATAALLTEFLPAMDTLVQLKNKYENDTFGKMYNALPDAIRSGYTSMGCTEYSVNEMDVFVPNRMISIDTEPSSTVPKDSVIRTIVPGIELQGNIVRLAQVITSSGTATAAEEGGATNDDDDAPIGPDSTDAKLP